MGRAPNGLAPALMSWAAPQAWWEMLCPGDPGSCGGMAPNSPDPDQRGEAPAAQLEARRGQRHEHAVTRDRPEDGKRAPSVCPDPDGSIRTSRRPRPNSVPANSRRFAFMITGKHRVRLPQVHGVPVPAAQRAVRDERLDPASQRRPRGPVAEGPEDRAVSHPRRRPLVWNQQLVGSDVRVRTTPATTTRCPEHPPGPRCRSRAEVCPRIALPLASASRNVSSVGSRPSPPKRHGESSESPSRRGLTTSRGRARAGQPHGAPDEGERRSHAGETADAIGEAGRQPARRPRERRLRR
jgi:hypothetical protein